MFCYIKKEMLGEVLTPVPSVQSHCFQWGSISVGRPNLLLRVLLLSSILDYLKALQLLVMDFLGTMISFSSFLTIAFESSSLDLQTCIRNGSFFHMQQFHNLRENKSFLNRVLRLSQQAIKHWYDLPRDVTDPPTLGCSK